MKPFYPLLLGGDINVYSMARAFHEEYGLKSTVFGKYPSGPCFDSKIIDLHTFGDDNDNPEVCVENIRAFAADHADDTVLLIGCGDSYVQLIAENLDKLPENVVAPYINGELMNTLIHKERFYAMCDEYGIDHPDTFIYRREMGEDFELPFAFPCIAKPANSVMYWQFPFLSQKKVYVVNTLGELHAVLKQIYDAGYTDSMILQDMIPGDDSYMRVLTSYSDRNHKVTMMCLGHVLLEEHTPHGIGNHAVILNEREEQLTAKIRTFLEQIQYTGFSNFDIKFDERDGKYKVFEINCRQGRSNFYVTGMGYNLAKMVVEDRLEGKDATLTMADREHLWTVVPKQVLFDYTPEQYHATLRRLLKEKKWVNPLIYKADRAPKRALRLFKSRMGHIVKFRKYLGK